MNNQEAKQTILEADSCFCKHGAYKDCHSGCKYREALDAAVKALEQEPTTKNDLGVDAVSRADAIDIIQEMHGLAKADVISYAVNRIIELPSVTPQEPKTGHWVKTPKAVMGEGYMWYCDKCGYRVYQDSSRDYPSEKYCPDCGHRMVEPQESEDKE